MCSVLRKFFKFEESLKYTNYTKKTRSHNAPSQSPEVTTYRHYVYDPKILQTNKSKTKNKNAHEKYIGNVATVLKGSKKTVERRRSSLCLWLWAGGWKYMNVAEGF